MVRTITEVCTGHPSVTRTLHGVGTLWEVGWGNFEEYFHVE